MSFFRWSLILSGSTRQLTNLGRRFWQNRQGAIYSPVPYAADPTAFLKLPLLSGEESQFRAFGIVEYDSGRTMSTDAEYEAFLEKANRDTRSGGAGKETAVTTSQAKSSNLTTVNTVVPAALQDVQEFFISDSDEPFEPVSLRWTEKKMPSTGMCVWLICCIFFFVGSAQN